MMTVDFGPEMEIPPVLCMKNDKMVKNSRKCISIAKISQFPSRNSENIDKIIRNVVKSTDFQPPLNFLELWNDHILKSGNKTANVNAQTAVYP